MADPRGIASRGGRATESISNEHDLVTKGDENLLREVGDFRTAQIAHELLFRIKIYEEDLELRACTEGGGRAALIITQQGKPECHFWGKAEKRVWGKQASTKTRIYMAANCRTQWSHTNRLYITRFQR